MLSRVALRKGLDRGTENTSAHAGYRYHPVLSTQMQAMAAM